jgi:hypothetical protein
MLPDHQGRVAMVFVYGSGVLVAYIIRRKEDFLGALCFLVLVGENWERSKNFRKMALAQVSMLTSVVLLVSRYL